MNTMQILKVVFSVAIAAVVNPVVTLGLKAEGAGYILAVSIGASTGCAAIYISMRLFEAFVPSSRSRGSSYGD
ncbi:MAG: hypothetical protein A3E98_00435 [Candidatus Doudnabacteria bacterium RIFCSPHIGHO2_12_FULL_48_11]|uniref:Uncharacterized protein n=1 Tax=Candidatus Doudnabacteria bacterium RIFCSPHIGHO2_01_FULL_46_24 TaxID=1817825 RepID=A0A1F5NVV7_9BACT|nr:MAG: hypothetical protein A2720_02980 [Candidatus Doudnabacteria bacterium RIFCSPHIGHO2_01_FULL_46_24]OGE95903.1 MAG: hypothetical protein A3E98_00435 [Candidatus Doudnabacteria bacterium RIFCSPHIGHO2_12_FULL_48_11]